jgi:hypothetical protein
MFIFLRNLFRFSDAQQRRKVIQDRMKLEALAAGELGREARDKNFFLERMLRETQEEEQQARTKDQPGS